jgi:hypothetical protein
MTRQVEAEGCDIKENPDAPGERLQKKIPARAGTFTSPTNTFEGHAFAGAASSA